MDAVSGVLSAATAEAIPRTYNFARDIFERNDGRRQRLAYIDQRGSWTYQQLRQRAEAFAQVLEALQVRPEERVLMCLLDSIDWPTVFLGTLHAGRVAIPVNTLMTEDDYRYMLEDSRARVLVVSQQLYPKFANLIGAVYGLKVIVSGENPHGHQLLEDLLKSIPAHQSYRPPPTTRDDIAFWLYTSGSTGKPKAAVHVHADLRLTNDLYAAPILGLTENDVVYSVAKLFFAYGLGNAMTFPLSVGATTVLLPDRPTPEAVALILKKYKVTVFYAVPTFYAAFLASNVVPTQREVSMRCCVSAGEALPQEVGRRWHGRFGVDILDGLGSTEMLHIFLSNRLGDVKYGTTGTPVPGYEVRLLDEEGRLVRDGEIGELQVAGPTAAIHYWNNREKSRNTFHGRWTRTGDKYYCNARGRYVHAGRADDMLKVSGIYVSPIEVETALLSHPAVHEVAVIGKEDDVGLIKPLAFVVVRAGTNVDAALAESLKQHVKDKIAPYKYPRWIEFLPELPKTATGKIQRFRLREMVQCAPAGLPLR